MLKLQAVHIVAAFDGTLLPAGQSVQTVESESFAYLPSSHSMHRKAAIEEYVPALQSVHFEDPEDGAYFP